MPRGKQGKHCTFQHESIIPRPRHPVRAEVCQELQAAAIAGTETGLAWLRSDDQVDLSIFSKIVVSLVALLGPISVKQSVHTQPCRVGTVGNDDIVTNGLAEIRADANSSSIW